METLKNIFGALSNFAVKHGVTIIAVLVCTIFFLVHSLTKDIDHYSEIHKSELEKIELTNELGMAFDLVNNQARVIQTQSDKLESSDEILRMQSTAIRQLIEKLKSLGEWPLKPEARPIDPDNII